jgi:asparagine synthase (glutamine-hydrolysing)
MCGIAGILHLDGKPAAGTLLRRMTDAIAHRGPDGEGHYVEGPAGLGHRRLAILDLSPAGAQPMSTADGRYVLTYNGELYNHGALRRELEGDGWQFHSRSDTEVLLYALATWGIDAIKKLNGMFAFAFWDASEKTLLLARDRYGVKPLYWTVGSDKTLLFGSEAKAILAHGSVAAALDVEGLPEYLTFQNFVSDRTLFRGIRLLPAGSLLRFQVGSPDGESSRYWDYSFREPTNALSDEEYIERFDYLFRQAVSRQLMSDVPVGTYLSGGMDSGSISALAAREVPYIRSFTCGFDLNSASGVELSYDERPTAEYMSYLFRTEHYEMVLKAGDMERVMSRLSWHLEEPRVGQSYPNFYVAQLASKFVKVCLSGTGGDEIFGGYPWRYYRAISSASFGEYVDRYYGFWQRLLDDDALGRVLAPLRAETSGIDPKAIFRAVFAATDSNLQRPEDYLNHSLYFEAKTFLHGLLVVEDKLSMAHGLETRVPFLDNDLVDFAMELPARLKVANLEAVMRLDENDPGHKAARYFQRTNDGKVLLRRAMERYIPPSVTQREKQGFSAPDASWFKGESINYVRATLFDRKARIFDYLEPSAVRGLVEDHLEGRVNRRLLIWSLLNIEAWCKNFL